jgi:hypothetical protein
MNRVIYFYRAEGISVRGGPIAMSGFYERLPIVSRDGFEHALTELEAAFNKKFPGGTNFGLTALNRL